MRRKARFQSSRLKFNVPKRSDSSLRHFATPRETVRIRKFRLDPIFEIFLRNEPTEEAIK